MVRKYFKKITFCVVYLLMIFSASAPFARAQRINNQSTSTSSTSSGSASSVNVRQSSSDEEEEEFIEPSRPTVANSAEFQKPGVLQFEFGYEGLFRAREFRSQQSAPLTLRFAAGKRVLLDFNIDAVISEADEMRRRETGIGDARVGVQILALEDTERHPALAFAYYAKLPTASREKQLGTGRYDHRLVTLISKKFGDTDLDFNAAYLNVGREDSNRRASGGQAALSVTHKFKNNFGLIGEIAGQSEDDVLPRGVFALGAITYRFNKRVRFDTGVRFGLNREAPRVGVFAGFTVGIADFFKR